jgi:glycosyltransferase involved in cell wall biosynthesis
MTVHFYTKEPIERPASRQRAFLIAEELQKRGMRTRVHAPPIEVISEARWPKKFFFILAIVRSLFTIRKDDVIFLQRTISNKYFFVIMVAYLALFRRKMIFDFDDAIYMHSGFKTKVLTRMASAVFVCSTLLEEWAHQYNSRVHIFHTSFSFEWYRQYTKDYAAATEPCTIGWIGKGEEHTENLKLVARALDVLVERAVPFKFLLVGAWKDKRLYELFGRLPKGSVEMIDFLDWHAVPETIQRFDIGVMPLLEHNVWNSARSSYKLFEYMAIGVATLSSANGEIMNVIRDGENGFLADSEAEWAHKLERLARDWNLRMRLGKAGQAYVRDFESYEAIMPRIIDIIEQL